jgi:hypothetical protein
MSYLIIFLVALAGAGQPMQAAMWTSPRMAGAG